MSEADNEKIFSYLVVFTTPINDGKESEVVDAKNGKEAICKVRKKFADYYFAPTFLYVQKLD